MKQIYLLPLLLFFISCTNQNKTDLPKKDFNNQIDTQKINQAKLIATNSNNGDPTFVDVKDTFSIYGPSNITRNILQDRNGNIWFATWQGIIQYNPSAALRTGSKLFTNFTLKENLRRFHVFSIMEDRAGNIWFGTIGGGVYRYDGTYFINFTTNDGLVGNSVISMLEDKSGSIWFGTTNGLSRYYGKAFTNFTTEDGLMHNTVHAMVQDNYGRLWLGTQGGVNYFDEATLITSGKQSGKFTKKPDFPGNVRTMIKDKTGNIWIGSQGALSCFNPEKEKSGANSLVKTKTNFTGCICEDKKGNLWLSGGGSGTVGVFLCKYEPANGEKGFTEILVKNGRHDFGNQIFGIIEDKNGILWIATASGVCCYDGKTFNYFTK